MDSDFVNRIEFPKVDLRCTCKDKEEFCLALQQMQPEQIERNRRLMKAGLIKFDEYEEVL